MLIARIYGLSWVLVAAVVVALYATDSFTFAATMILGFTASVLTGAGMLVVYPAVMTERVSSERKAPKYAKPVNSPGRLQRAG